MKAVYNRRNSQNQAAFLPLGIGPDVGNGNMLDTLSVDATNPYNPFGVTLTPGQNYTAIFRRLVEAGQRTYSQTVDTMSLTGTLDGKFQMFGRNWYWDASAVIGYNDAKQLFTGNINAARLARAIGPVSQCTGDCVPFNFFGGVGSITPAMLGYIGFDERDRSRQVLNDYTANLSGELFDLPGGPVGIAIGYEHRYQFGSFTPDPIIQAGLGADIPAQAASGRFNVDEIYGEVRLPLLRDIPAIASLELNGAVRHSNYSTFGSNTTIAAAPCGSRSTTCSCAGNMRNRCARPRSASCSAPNRASTRRSTTPAPVPAAACSSRTRPSGPTASPMASPPMAAMPSHRASFPCSPAATATCNRKRRALCCSVASTAALGAWRHPVGAQPRGELLRHQGERRDRVDPAQVLLSRCAQTGDTLSCAAVRRAPSGIVTAINGLLLNTGGIRTKGIDATLTVRSGKPGRDGSACTSRATIC